jgi:cytochrome P450
MLSLVLVAGHETTVSLIANGVLTLLRNPEQLALTRSDPALLPQAVEELLRHVGPVAFSSIRFTAAEVRIGDVTLPAGEVVALGLWSADHDASRFPAPDAFEVGRIPEQQHVAFGRGAHFCLGAALARLETQVAIGTLLREFDDIALAGGDEELTWRPANTRGPLSLPVVLRNNRDR